MPMDSAAVARKLKLERRPVAGRARRVAGRSRGAVVGPRRDLGDVRRTGPHDWILLFVENRAALETALPAVAAALDVARHALDRLPEGRLEAPDGPDPRPGLGFAQGRRPDVAGARLDRRDVVGVLAPPLPPGEARQTFR